MKIKIKLNYITDNKINRYQTNPTRLVGMWIPLVGPKKKAQSQYFYFDKMPISLLLN